MSTIDGLKYTKTFHDFDIFKGCFGNSRIMPSDLDFIVERKANFLCMEFKPGDKTISMGQHILLQRLSRVPKFTVILVYHIKGRALHESVMATSMQIYPDGKRIECNNEDIIKCVSLWFENADKGFIEKR